MKRWLLTLIFCLFASQAWAQTCPTRPTGDNSNACASTAYVLNSGGGLYGAPLNAIPYGKGPGTLPAFAAACASGLMTYSSGSVPLCATAIPNGVTATTQGNTDNSAKIATDSFVINVSGTCQSAASQGFVGDGVTNNSAAWTTWTASIGGNSGCLQFGLGNYIFNADIAVTVAANKRITVRGLGQGQTTVTFPNISAGISFTLMAVSSAFSMQDLTWATSQIGQSVGVSCTGQGGGTGDAVNDLTRVTLQGSDGIQQTDYWLTAVTIDKCSNISFDGGGIFASSNSANGGAGISFGGSNPVYATQFNLSNYVIYGADGPIVLNSYWQGLSITNSVITACQNGIFQVAAQDGILSGLNVVNSNIACAINDIVASTAIDGVQITSNLLQAGATAANIINLGKTNNTIISSNIILASTGNAIAVSNTDASSYTDIGGNVITNGANGIVLTSSTSNVSVHDNRIAGAGTAITNAGTNNIIVNNPGYNPVGSVAAANVCASPCTVTAGASPEDHYLKQTATNTATVTIGGQLVATLANASTSYPIHLAPNQIMVVTWTTTDPTDTISKQ